MRRLISMTQEMGPHLTQLAWPAPISWKFQPPEQ
jgi:hypothetical protein